MKNYNNIINNWQKLYKEMEEMNLKLISDKVDLILQKNEMYSKYCSENDEKLKLLKKVNQLEIELMEIKNGRF